MDIQDCVSAYAALLSTALVIRELWKPRSTSPTRHALQARIDDPRLLRHSSLRGAEEGMLTKLRLRNPDSEDITIHAHALGIPGGWIPTPLLKPLGTRGVLPCAGTVAGKTRKWVRAKITIPAGQEAEINVVLWQRDRQALERGRLVMNMAPSGDRPRAQQVPIQCATPAPSMASKSAPTSAKKVGRNAATRTMTPRPTPL